MDSTSAHGLLRIRSERHHGRVSYVELFFDLVFVFAVTQLSHSLVEHFTPLGVAQTLLLLLAVWWAWMFTTWITNWLDPERTPVRIMLFALMLAGLAMSAAIPKAFETTGLVFAVAYVGIQVGRSAFVLAAFRGRRPAHHRNFQRVVVWLATAGAFWIAGGLAPGAWRFAFWSVALFIEYLGPWVYFWTPGLGRSTTKEWDIEPPHMAERCALFVIIALGESILVTGATFAKLAWTPAAVTAFVASFLASVAMWWIYFNIGAERATKHFAGAVDPGAVARLAYTYLHLPIVAGIIVTAAADEFVLAHPAGHTDAKTAVAVVGGPALYLLGNLLFKRATAGWYQLSHLVGLGLVGLAALLSFHASPLLLSIAATAVLVLVAAWETISLRPKEH